jgi:hypothetical protein
MNGKLLASFPYMKIKNKNSNSNPPLQTQKIKNKTFACSFCTLCSMWILLRDILSMQTNKKTRNKAYDTLVQIGHIYEDEEKGGTKENLHQFFNMVLDIVSGSFDGSF